MKFARYAFITTLTILALMITVSAQTLRSADDDRNQAPTVGTGGPPGGPTGLFTIYDGSTIRKGEYTFSAAYSNYDRDPGNVDISEVPISFQVGLSDYLELFFTTDAYRGVKVNSPRNLSGFYLPNSQLSINGRLQSLPAIVLAPQGTGPSQYANTAVFRPTGSAPFTPFPYNGAFGGTFGIVPPINPGAVFGFPAGVITLGPATNTGNNGASNFPGIGSVFGSILPGVVLQTTRIPGRAPGTTTEVPTSFTTAPSYLPDAPLLNRTYGESAFSTFTVGGKIRFTGPQNPIGIGIIPFYRFYADNADDFGGFNQLQRGASPGAKRGDFGLVAFADARVRKWMNISGNIGYIYNGDIESGNATLLDRPDEVLAGIGLDFPVNRYFQPILEFRSTQYVGGRTPNAFENSPIEGLAGARVFPARWISLGGYYRYHFNQQDRDSFSDNQFVNNVNIAGANNLNIASTFTGIPPGFRQSNDPHGFGGSISIGRRNERLPISVPNQPADVTALDLSDMTIYNPCPPGKRPVEGGNCSDNQSVDVQTTATDPENDVLTYEYTVSGGKVVGSGANVSWDLSGVQPGTYTITAGVNDGCGICGKTETKTITVEDCECEDECECPDGVNVTGPAGVTAPGGTMTFTASVSGSQDNITYNWSVDQGTIVSGQGTPSIRVSTTADMAGSNVVATVEVANDCASCGTLTGSDQGPIAPTDPCLENPESCEVYDVSNDEIKAEIDGAWLQFTNAGANGEIYIINYGTRRQLRSRNRQIDAAINFRGYDKSRFTIVDVEQSGNRIVRSRIFVLPAGAPRPAP